MAVAKKYVNWVASQLGMDHWLIDKSSCFG